MVGLKAPGVRQLRHTEQVDLVPDDQGGPRLREGREVTTNRSTFMPQRFGTTIAANRARLDAVEQLAQIHRWDPRTSDEETFSALTDLQRAGKIRYFGSSTSRPTGAVCCESEAKSRL